MIAIYSESLGNPAKFARIARRVSLRRPIVTVRTGTALSGEGTDALYAHTGVIEVPTVTALLDTVRTLSTQSLMNGRRVAVVSNSKSPTVLATGSLVRAGLEAVTPLRPLTWRSTPADYRTALAEAIADPQIDAVMVIHAPPLQHAIGEPTQEIEEACRDAPKPVVAIMLGAGNGPLTPGSPIPSFRFPEQPAAVLGRIAYYSEWRRAEERERAELESVRDALDVAGAAALIAEHVDAYEVPPEVVAALLACYGVTMAEGRLVDASVAVRAAEAIGYPVAIKAQHRRVGRTVAAGIALDLVDAAEVVAAVAAMRGHLGHDAERVVVQRMVPPGLDVRVRVRDDERVGPVISVGLGGVQADTIGDEVSRLAPVSPSSAATMIRQTRAGGALDETEIGRLGGLVARVTQLAVDNHEIAELDLNPVVVAGDCWVVDARLSLRHPERAGPAPRRL